MDFFKAIKVVVILVVGFCVLSLIAFLGSVTIFRSSVTTTEDNVVVDEQSAGAPSYDAGNGVTGSKDLLYPTPIYNNGGDGSKLIKSASLGLRVKDFDTTVNDIKSKVAEAKGFVQYLSDSGTLNNRTVSMIVRVPEDKFDSTLSLFKGFATEVVSSNEGSDDISQTYQDMQARLKSQKALEKQYLTLLNKATKIEDILNIQKELATVRQEIESYESQLKNYDTQVKMASISVSLYQAKEAINVVGNQWQLTGVAKEAFAALVSFGKGLLTLTVWAVVFSPIVLIPYGVFVLVRNSKKEKKSK